MGFFDILFASDSEITEMEHNEGQAAGSQAGIIDDLWHNTVDQFFVSDAYNKGWDNGVENQPYDD
ncbi:MAG TPA: hypothetical protein VN956_00720 [Pyrinomonadaceae bacterium]|nr:hypothetical protein [Pyrinomonadaceae bacterium]